MSTYIVTLKETVKYVVEVEATTASEAADFAEQDWCNSENPTDDFAGEGEGVTVSMILQRKKS